MMQAKLHVRKAKFDEFTTPDGLKRFVESRGVVHLTMNVRG
jgi:hypothetical protein